VTTTILGIPFTIELLCPQLTGDGHFGNCDAKAATIQIDGNMPRPIREQTLIHEWIHAVTILNGYALEEFAVNVIASELYREGFRVKTKGGSL